MQIRGLLQTLVGLGSCITEAAHNKTGQGNHTSYFTIVSVLCQWCYSIFITLYWHKAIHIQANGSSPGVLIQVLDEK